MHRRKLRVEKGEEQKTALLLIHDQGKYGTKNKPSKVCIHWERGLLLWERSRPKQN